MLALIYARESVFEAKAGTRSTDEQTDEGVKRCDHRGWEPIRVDGELSLVDSGKGASRRSRGKREAWERAKRILAGKELGVPKPDVLVCWAASRAQRDLAHYVELRDLCAEHGVLWDYNGQTYNLADDDDRFRTGLDALLAEREAAEISKNVRRALNANFAQGRPHGKVLFGYERIYDPKTGALDGQVPSPIEAPIVVRVFREWVKGCSLRAISAGLNGDGLLKRGNPWKGERIAALLDNPAYKGQSVRNGETVEAGWEPLVPVEVWDQAQARRRSVRERQVRQSPTARMLTGVLRCGREGCGGRTVTRPSTTKTGGRRRIYACRECGRTNRDCNRLDTWVSGLVLARIARQDPEAAAEGEDPAVEAARLRLKQLKAELEEAMGLWQQRNPDGTRKLSAQAYAMMEADLVPQIAVADRELRSAVLPIDIDDAPSDPEDLPAWWAAVGPERRREIVSGYIVEIVLHPLGRGRRVYDDADYATIEWRR